MRTSFTEPNRQLTDGVWQVVAHFSQLRTGRFAPVRSRTLTHPCLIEGSRAEVEDDKIVGVIDI